MFTGREFSNVSDKAYWAWSYKHLQLLDREMPVCRESFNAGFYLGAQYAVRVSGELSPHVARFMEFIMWLTERQEDGGTEIRKSEFGETSGAILDGTPELPTSG